MSGPLPPDHPGHPEDVDRGKVEFSYEGYRFPPWVLVVWLAFFGFGVGYLLIYLVPMILQT